MNNIILYVIFICFVGIFVFVLTRNVSNELHDLNSKIDKSITQESSINSDGKLLKNFVV